MGVSIADVASAAGVSTTTVSHVISGNRAVSDKLTARVRSVMVEMAYQPSRAARSLALGKTEVIGLLVPDIARPFFAHLASAIEMAAGEHGYNLIVGNTGRDRERALAQLKMIHSHAVDGAIYAVGSPIDEDVVSAMGELPLVLLDDEDERADFTSFVSDNWDGGGQAARHLNGLGHRGALIVKNCAHVATMESRARGFIAEWESTPGATHELVRLDELDRVLPSLRDGRLTAVFAVNDHAAFEVLRALRAADIRVPERVSVVGFDGVPAAEHTWPPLTTVTQDFELLGRSAAEALIKILSGEELQNSHRRLPVSLTVRESTASVTRHTPSQ